MVTFHFKYMLSSIYNNLTGIVNSVEVHVLTTTVFVIGKHVIMTIIDDFGAQEVKSRGGV